MILSGLRPQDLPLAFLLFVFLLMAVHFFVEAIFPRKK